jgi:hypothetical protein
MFLAYPLTDTCCFREIVKELHARDGIREDRSAATESQDVTAPVPES